MPFYESVRPYKRMPNNGKFIADLLITGRKFSQEKFMRIIIMVTIWRFCKKTDSAKKRGHYWCFERLATDNNKTRLVNLKQFDLPLSLSEYLLMTFQFVELPQYANNNSNNNNNNNNNNNRTGIKRIRTKSKICL